MSRWTAALAQRLGELGWIEGRTVAIEYRWAEGRPERYAEIAAEFVSRRVDVIVTTVPAAPAAKQATSVIPIVFILASDPVGSGLVASLARPGGNVTGLSTMSVELGGKRLGLLHELIPGALRIVALINPNSAIAEPLIREAQAGLRRLDGRSTSSRSASPRDSAPTPRPWKGSGNSTKKTGAFATTSQSRTGDRLN